MNYMTKTVSVVIPVRNENKYLEGFLQSLLQQSYPKQQMEWLFVDGMSTDDTRAILQAHAEDRPDLIRIIENPEQTVPYAMNRGIRAAAGKYIVRLDAHSEYAPDYIERCVWHLEHSDADNVGGVAEAAGRNPMGKTIAKVLGSRFGVGNSQFRTGGQGYVDTVPFGAYRREIFDRIGYYDERLTRNQDNELNFRVRKHGGKILLAPDIRFTYYGRDTVASLAKMARQNGYWNVVTMHLMPGSMGVRHFIPLVFVVSLILLPLLGFLHPLFHRLLLAELVLYFALAFAFAWRLKDNMREFALLVFLFPLFHISYGLGSLHGILDTFITKKALRTRGKENA